MLSSSFNKDKRNVLVEVKDHAGSVINMEDYNGDISINLMTNILIDKIFKGNNMTMFYLRFVRGKVTNLLEIELHVLRCHKP